MPSWQRRIEFPLAKNTKGQRLYSGQITFESISDDILNVWKPTLLNLTDIEDYYSTHCNTAQIWSCCTEYSSSVVNRYPALHIVSRVGGGEWQNKDRHQLFCNKTVLRYQCVEAQYTLRMFFYEEGPFNLKEKVSSLTKRDIGEI